MASLRAYLGTWMVRNKVRGPLSKARDAAAFRRIFEAPAFPDPKGVTYEPGTLGGGAGGMGPAEIRIGVCGCSTSMAAASSPARRAPIGR